MTTRESINRGRLTYTCNCGWIDVGHLTSTPRPHASAMYLWQDILHERGLTIGNQRDRHVIGYKQRMAKMGMSSEHFRAYWIKRSLSLSQKQSVALSIFMEVSYGFENLQHGMSLFTNSGFSEEDLVSNLVGFYVQVLGLNWIDYCKPVSADASHAVWDANGPVGMYKNRTFKPNFYTCQECKDKHHIEKPAFPTIFSSIQPAKKGVEFGDLGDSPVPRHLHSALFR